MKNFSARELGAYDGATIVEGRTHGIGQLVRRIERATGLRCCAGPQLDHHDGTGGATYQLTLGTACRGGGYSPSKRVSVQLWT